ncbi:hypothetical protein ACOMHN_045540 [Nucella lapillus]
MAKLLGVRIIRGPDWQRGDEDGGEGYLGTVTQLLGNHEARVLWDMGEESTCRTGEGGKFDLRVYDTAPAGIRHVNTVCAHCGEKDVGGTLWRCQLCPTCHLCSLCYTDDMHDTGHPFLRVDAPNTSGQPQPKRKASVKVRTIGLHPGAKVIRGKDWEYGDQDGGQGLEGEVEGHEDAPEAPRGLVRVRWSDGSTQSYRLGVGGKVDVTCVEEEVGPFYYRDHLPLLDTTETTTVPEDSTATLTPESALKASPPSLSEQSVTGASTQEEITNVARAAFTRPEQQSSSVAEGVEDEELKEGDQVVIKVDEDQLQELQKDCGGCTARMLRCFGRTGEVTGITAGGVVAVKFDGSSKISYRFSSKALLKVTTSFKVDDLVRIRDDLTMLQVLNRRVKWLSKMDKTVNRVGRVVKVDTNEHLHVDFRGGRFIYEPACCLPVPVGTPVDNLYPSSSASLIEGSDKQNEHMRLFRNVRDLVQGQGQGRGQSARSLFAAIQFGDADRVRELCQEDPSMIERENQGITPLIFASLRGRESCAVALLDLGADVNRSASDSYEKTPLSAVREGESEELAELLLSRGAKPDYLFSHGMTLAHLCALHNKVVIMKALINHGADLNIKSKERQTPLHLAIELRKYEVMEVLVECPRVNIYLRNHKDFDMIQLASYKGISRALERLLARDNSGVENTGKHHSTALHIAATNDYVDCVRLLVLQGGANINARQDKSHLTPLMLACHGGKLESVEALLELGADVNLLDGKGHTALHLTFGGSMDGKSQPMEVLVAYRVQIANLLISNGAYVDAQDFEGREPFTYGPSVLHNGVKAFMKHNQDVVRMKKRDTQTLLQSLGVSSLADYGPGQLKEALKGIQLPCGICGASKSDVTLQPCTHQCVCRKCSVKVARCPLCDEEVKDKVVCSD